MIDPFTALAGASKAYAMAKAMVEAGRSAEDTFIQLSTWMGHASDFSFAEKKSKRIKPFKKVVFSKSVEAESARMFAQKRKLDQQRRELMTMISYAYGKEGLNEFIALKRQIQKERDEAVYKQAEMRDQIIHGFLILILLGCLAGLIAFMLS